MDQKIKDRSHFHETIENYIRQSEGLELVEANSENYKISQRVDNRVLEFKKEIVEEVIARTDSDGKGFLQVNFLNGQKILLTGKLIGFKPAPRTGLDMQKIPRVVTTPDLMSVVDAIEDGLAADQPHDDEIEVLKKVFDSVLHGAEAVGFKLGSEREWLQRLIPIKGKHTA